MAPVPRNSRCPFLGAAGTGFAAGAGACVAGPGAVLPAGQTEVSVSATPSGVARVYLMRQCHPDAAFDAPAIGPKPNTSAAPASSLAIRSPLQDFISKPSL